MKETDGFADRQAQHFVNVQPLVLHLERAALVPRALALFANQFDIREELHFYRNRAVSLAHFAAPTRNIEGEMPRGISSPLRFRRVRERLADQVERFDV